MSFNINNYNLSLRHRYLPGQQNQGAPVGNQGSYGGFDQSSPSNQPFNNQGQGQGQGQFGGAMSPAASAVPMGYPA